MLWFRFFLSPLLLLFLTFGAMAQPTQSDEFQSSFNKPLRKPATNFAKHPNQRIDGLLPMPWNDDSAWCDLEVEYLQLQENPGEGEQSLRVVVKRLPKGSRAQFGLRDFPLKADKEVSIRFLAKSPDYTPVTLIVVQKKSPYKTHFTQRIQPSAEWAEYEVLVPGGMQDADTQLLFTIEQPGTFDLDNFRYQRRKFEAADISSDKLGNLLPSSVFPLGAAPPWVAHGFGKVETGELTGPTGAPALVLDVRRQPGFSRFEQSLRVGYKATAGQMATVRVSANLLEGEAEIALRTGVEKIWESPWGTAAKMDRGWRTYEHKVMLPVSPRGYYQLQIAFEGAGKVAIDRIQVTQNDKLFALTGPVELALDSVQPYGLVTDEEPFGIRIAVVGNLKAARNIQLTLTDISGSSVEVGRYPMPEAPYVPLTTEIAPPKGLKTFGSFRLEATAIGADGKPVGNPAELLLHRVRKARFADSPAPDSPFGIHYRTSHLDDDVAVLKKLGFNWLRLFKTFSWKRVEQMKGQMDFAQTDRDMEILAQNNLLALGILGDGAPTWAAKNRDPNFKGWACWTPRDPAEFADYCAKIFERYGDQVTVYEPWNEPYYAGFFTDRIESGKRIIGSAADYLAIQKLVFEKARASGKPVRIGWNTNALEEMPRTRELIGLGILNFTDFVSLHHYLTQPDPAPELGKQARLMREAMGATELTIWNTEGGLGPFTTFNFYKHVPPTQNVRQQIMYAEWYARYYIACLASGVKNFFAYVFSAPNFWAPDYSLNNIDGRLGPNLTAISALAWQVDGTNFAQTVTLSDGARAEIFEGSGRAVACILPLPGKARTLPSDPAIEAYDLFGNLLAPGTEAPAGLHYLQTTKPAAWLAEQLAQ